MIRLHRWFQPNMIAEYVPLALVPRVSRDGVFTAKALLPMIMAFPRHSWPTGFAYVYLPRTSDIGPGPGPAKCLAAHLKWLADRGYPMPAMFKTEWEQGYVVMANSGLSLLKNIGS
jgi:hypothetical protein